MVTQLKANLISLYDTDYNLWVLETVKQLENKAFSSLDLDNLIEEVLNLSRREQRKLKNLLRRLFEHLLKLAYWQSEREYNQNHWKREIRNFRKQIKDQLKISPSLNNYLLEIFAECYQDARELLADDSGLPLNTFPELPLGNLSEILDENWLP